MGRFGGDPTPRNLLLNGDKVEALLDWETRHVGDPAEDLAYVREEMPSDVLWKTFYDAYLAHGRVPVPEERHLYWEQEIPVRHDLIGDDDVGHRRRQRG